MKHRVSCAGKQTFPTMRAAEQVARVGRRRNNCVLRPYRCEVCRAYHVGNRPPIQRHKAKEIYE